MVGSSNVEETALIANWDLEKVQSWSIALMYFTNSYCLLCMAQSINNKVCFFKFHMLTCWHIMYDDVWHILYYVYGSIKRPC